MATGEKADGRSKEVDVRIGGAQIHLKQVQLRDDILIDEIHLDGKELEYQTRKTEASDSVQNKISVADTGFTAMMIEPNINRLLMANMPADAPVRNVRLFLLSGKARITGHFVKSVISLPFTVEAVPIVDNGVRVHLDFQEARIGFKLPGSVLDVIEQVINRSLSLDLSRLSVPVRLDEIKCEPGRLTIKGQARIAWPPVSVAPPPAPFSALDRPLPDEIAPSAPAPLLSTSSDSSK
jgi:hypothetical protein